MEQYLGKLGCCAGGECGGEKQLDLAADVIPVLGMEARARNGKPGAESLESIAGEFFARALAEDLSPADVFRITITSFLDAYNFDVRRLMKCCIHHVLPSGHVIPFCAYNVLYREGHVKLPELRRSLAVCSK
ncbi:MAG: hypothetical protein L0Y70_27360, partial [Gemmataceae bacterium]|nr:hypothetical protein [Gemmataceae bacterium]